MLITRLLLVLDVWDGKPTYRKSCAGNLLVWLDLTLGPSFIAKLKSAYTRLLLVLEVLVHCLYGGYNLHRFSDALGLVISRPACRREIIICTMCVCTCVRACVTQFSLKLLQLHIFGKSQVLMNFFALQYFWGLVNFGLLLSE